MLYANDMAATSFVTFICVVEGNLHSPKTYYCAKKQGNLRTRHSFPASNRWLLFKCRHNPVPTPHVMMGEEVSEKGKHWLDQSHILLNHSHMGGFFKHRERWLLKFLACWNLARKQCSVVSFCGVSCDLMNRTFPFLPTLQKMWSRDLLWNVPKAGTQLITHNMKWNRNS